MSVTLRGVAHDYADDAARQDDFEVVAVLHLRHDEREDKSNRQAKKNPKR